MGDRAATSVGNELYHNLAVKRSVLPNGLTILTEEIPYLRSVSLGVWVIKGSRHEPPALSGIFHCLEHMLFKGTERRDARTIARLIDSIGGHVNAFTGKENMCYYVRVLDEFVPTAVDLLSDLILRPTFLGDELERERKVILEEIKMVEDTPDDLVHTMFTQHFWKGHPLARPILGTRKTVSGIDSATLRSFFGDHITADNLLVSAAGHLEHGPMVDLLGEAFAGLKPKGVSLPKKPAPVAKPVTSFRKKRSLSQTYVCLGTPSPHRTHPDRYALSVLNGVLGMGMSSRLFQRIREELSLAYDVYSDLVAYSDAGYLVIYAGTNGESVPRLIDAVLQELRSMKHEPVSEEELRRAKDQMKGSIMLGLESTFNRMSSLAGQEMDYGRQISLDEVLQSIEGVTAADVLRVAQEVFSAGPMALTMLGRSDEGLAIEPASLVC